MHAFCGMYRHIPNIADDFAYDFDFIFSGWFRVCTTMTSHTSLFQLQLTTSRVIIIFYAPDRVRRTLQAHSQSQNLCSVKISDL